MVKGATKGGIRMLVGSIEPQITRVSITSCEGTIRNKIERPMRLTYSNKLIQEDLSKMRPRRNVQTKDACSAGGRELELFEYTRRGHCEVDLVKKVFVLNVDEQACNVASQDLGSYVSV